MGFSLIFTAANIIIQKQKVAAAMDSDKPSDAPRGFFGSPFFRIAIPLTGLSWVFYFVGYCGPALITRTANSIPEDSFGTKLVWWSFSHPCVIMVSTHSAATLAAWLCYKIWPTKTDREPTPQ